MFFVHTGPKRAPSLRKFTDPVTEVAELNDAPEIWVCKQKINVLNDKIQTLDYDCIVYLCYSSHLWYFHNNN